MLILFVLAIAGDSPEQMERQAKATARILKPIEVSKDAWERTPLERKRKVVVREKDGTQVEIFIIDNE